MPDITDMRGYIETLEAMGELSLSRAPKTHCTFPWRPCMGWIFF